MKRSRKILILIIVLTLVMQVAQPTKNISEGPQPADIAAVYDMPEELQTMLEQKCYDCHSNNTRYPWYFHVQPIGWWLAYHIHEGKEELNFSEFKNYKADRAAHKLEEIGEVTHDGSMPLKAYTMFHPDTELNEKDKALIENWLKSVAGNH
jgi:hypothetical protein